MVELKDDNDSQFSYVPQDKNPNYTPDVVNIRITELQGSGFLAVTVTDLTTF